ncbi:sucrase/ferredoxin domain-containing protein [Plectosphaerella cucumerina]|uniref:Defect at low temperature protein 1 n=1 Tax=Plectosphaerella cucumerina TaxID=40658 RepID=A0A8K0T519_9PEZI|nr:sucrase/ferredoxin domain-containing protein [Plectosphaerella cucumerina]
MFSPRAVFRFIYNSSYFILCAVTTALLCVTPGDIIWQSLRRKQYNNIWLLASFVIGTMLIVSFVYALRIYNNKTILASIPKAWVPVEKGDVPKRVFRMISAGLDRSAAIAYEARPRHVADLDVPNATADPDRDSVVSLAGNENHRGEKDERAAAEGFQLLKVRTLSDVERMLGTPLPRHRPVWGEVEHGGWAPPDSADIPNLQYGAVVAELPHLIEGKALTLAPPAEADDGDAPTVNVEVAEMLQRPPHLGLRQYLTRLAELGVLPMDATTNEFLAVYEQARFSVRPIGLDRFRDLMHLFAALLRSMGPMDPAALDPLEEADVEDDEDRGTAYDSDIDSRGPDSSSIHTSPRGSLSRSVTRSTTGSRRRVLFGGRSASAGTWQNAYRTAPSTMNARSTGTASETSSVVDHTRPRQLFHSYSNASMRSKASSGSGASVIRLAGRADMTDLPYVLSLADTR